MTRAADTLRRSLAALLLALAPGMAKAACINTTFENSPFTVCDVNAGEDLRLFLDDAEGVPYGSFAGIESALAAEGAALVFAMNAGMYHPDRSPVGLYIENGAQRRGIVTREGPGNFGMLPNGVFCIAEDRFSIVESRAFADSPLPCRHATQSGPMLVIDGELHPRFLADSPSLFLRNGVGVTEDGQRALFVISNRPVTFHVFARFFRDHLELPRALFFDGNVSRLHAPELGRSDWGRAMGPIVGLVAPLN